MKNQETKLVPVMDLRVGDEVDLAGDKYADDGTNAVFDFEYVPVVEAPKRESPNCVAVAFDFDTVGFPTDHKLPVRIKTP